MQLALPSTRVPSFVQRAWSPLGVLYISTFIFSFTAIAHESNFIAATSFLFGDTATQAGLLLAFVFFGMLAGAWLSKKFPDSRLLEAFIIGELLLTIAAGFSIVFGFWVYATSEHYVLLIRLNIFLVSTLVGLEDAAVIRYANRYESETKDAIGNGMMMNNLGSAIAGLFFGTILVPFFGGMLNVALILGVLDSIVVAIVILRFKDQLIRWPIYLMICVVSGFVLFATYSGSDELSKNLTNPLYDDMITRQWNSPYANIVLTREDKEIRLYINGGLQFSSTDEVQYHEPLIMPALNLASQRVANRPLVVAIAGGGDGLGSRDVLKHSNVGELHIVDLDAVMTGEVALSEPIVTLNQHAFEDSRVTIHNTDAFIFFRDTEERFDVIIVDLVDPNNDVVSKLYTVEFYQMLSKKLNHGGVVVTQSTSPWYSPEAFWTINLTMEETFSTVVPYRWAVPSFGDWGWNMASHVEFERTEIDIDETLTTWLTSTGWDSLHFFSPDEFKIRDQLKSLGVVNRLINPILSVYYNHSSRWDRWGEE